MDGIGVTTVVGRAPQLLDAQRERARFCMDDCTKFADEKDCLARGSAHLFAAAGTMNRQPPSRQRTIPVISMDTVVARGKGSQAGCPVGADPLYPGHQPWQFAGPSMSESCVICSLQPWSCLEVLMTAGITKKLWRGRSFPGD